jgi:hypothetical protein
MSVSSILDSAAGRAFFKGRVQRPTSSAPALTARFEPISDHPQRIGTAFDYALRVGLAARGWARMGETIAQTALRRRRTELEGAGALTQATALVTESIQVLRGLGAGPLTDGAARACWDLAGIDPVYRRGRTEEIGVPASTDDLVELQALYDLVRWDEFQPAHELVLNPRFQEGSHLVGGADADLYLDGCIIDIKTTARPRLDLDYIRQLLCYAALASVHGISGIDKAPVSELGVYFSRAGVQVRFRPEEVLVNLSLLEVAQFLVKAARFDR